MRNETLEDALEIGLKAPEKMKYASEHYEKAYELLLKDDSLPNNVTNYHDVVGGGNFKTTKIAFDFLSSKGNVVQPSVSPRPEWHDRFVASIAQSAEKLWPEISANMNAEVAEKVGIAEAKQKKAEQACIEFENYIDKVDCQKQELVESIKALKPLEDKNKELSQQVLILKEKLSDITATLSLRNSEIKQLSDRNDRLQQVAIDSAKTQAKYDELLKHFEKLEAQRDDLVLKVSAMASHTAAVLPTPDTQGSEIDVIIEGEDSAPF